MEARKKRSTKLLAWLAAIAVVFAMTLPSSVVWADETEDSTDAGTAEAVAQIGNDTYITLAEAVNSVSDDTQTTITLLKDVYLETSIRIENTKNIVLDLNSKNITVSQTNGRSLYAIDNYGTLTVQDTSVNANGRITARGVENFGTMYMKGGTIASCDSNGGGAAVWNEGKMEMTGGKLAFTGNKSGDIAGSPFSNAKGTAEAMISGGTLESPYTSIFVNAGKVSVKNITLSTETDYWMAVKVFSDGEINLENVTINAQKGGCLENAGGSAVLENCTFTQTVTGTPTYVSCSIATSNGGMTTVKSGTYTASTWGAYVYNSGGTINIEGGTFNALTVFKADDSTSSSPSIIRVSGGEFTGNYSIGTQSTLSVSGGTYSEDVSNYVVAGNKTVSNGDGTYSVSVDTDTAVAVVNDVGYATLQDAVNAGGDVTLLKDVTEDITIGKDVNVTLDLNGHKLTNYSNHTIINKGTITINDSSEGKTGTIDNITHAKAALFNDVGGKAILNGGRFIRSHENGINESNNGGNSYYAVLNHGTMEINEGVSIVQKGHYSSLLENGWQDGKQKPSEATNSILIINGGTFSGGLNTIKNDDYGEMTINGGLFENISQAAFLNWNVAVVNGGTFDATGATHAVILNGKSDDTMDKGKLIINGGNFDGGSNAVIQMMSSQFYFGNIEIKGGSFSGDKGIVGTVKDGDSIELSGGEYTVQPNKSYIVLEKVAIGYTKAGETKYYIGPETEIKELVSKAASGDEITVIQGDLNLTNVPAGVTVANDGDGNVTVNGTAVAAGKSVTVPRPVPPVVKADYSKVDAAIAKANSLTASNYKDFSAVEAAIKAVVRDKNSSAQAEVDAMAKAIEDAIGALQYKDADYTAVDAALEKAAALNKDDYKDFSAVEAAIAAVVRDKNITQQAEVDAMAKAIEDAIAALEAAPKPEPEPAETVTKADIAAGTMALNKKIKATWTNSNLAVTWGKVSKADGYEVYAAKCGNSYTKVKTVKGSDTLKYTVKKINGKKLNTKTTYKVCVKAYRLIDGKKKYTGTSYGMHTVGLKNKTYTNAKSVKAAKKSITLKKGKTQKAAVTITKQTNKKKLLKSSHVANLRYFSTNTKVATVTKAGTIKAAGKGTCTVYALAANGVKTTVKVTVK